MVFHVQTILSLAALVGGLLAVLQVLAAARLRTPALWCWAASTLLVTASSVLLAVRPVIGLAPSVLLGNACVLASMGLIFSGVRLFDGRAPRFGLVGFIAILGVAALALSLATGDHIADRITLMSFLASGWVATAAGALLRADGTGPLVSRLASVGVLIVVALLYVARGIGAQFGVFATPGGAVPDPVEAFVVILGLGLFIAWTFGSLFMVLERLASLDDLTGLPNRRAVLQRGADMLRAARARRQPFSLLLADLDHFKQVNDRFGHDVGDAVLRRFAVVAANGVRAKDMVGRHGGEEFCILLPDADQAAALMASERLRRQVQAQLRRVEGRDTRVTLTVGAATYTPGAPSFGSIPAMIAAADAALYAAKTQGRNRVVTAVFPGEAPSLPSRVAAQPLR